jgi:hypothetical protein
LAPTKRIAMVDLHRLNSEIVKAIVEHHEMLSVVYEHPGPADLSKVVEDSRADVLIVGADYANAEAMCDLLEQHPKLKALAVDNGGHSGDLYEWRPQRTHLGELSPDSLLVAILDSVQDCRSLVS